VIVLADARSEIAGYVDALFGVYILILIAYIVTSLIFAFGVRIPYNRVTNGILSFLRDVSEPFLRIFRRVIPPIGPLDLSPIIAIFLLQIVRSIVVRLIEG
jgi:YggT family protein